MFTVGPSLWVGSSNITATIPSFNVPGGVIVSGAESPTFANSNRDVTLGPLTGLVNAYAETHRRRLGGKYYAEVKVVSRSGTFPCDGQIRIVFKTTTWPIGTTNSRNFTIGLMANPTVNYSDGLGSTVTGPSVPATETHPWTGNPMVATGAVIGMAIDTDARKLWVSYNGAWIGGGDPSAGTLPTMVAGNAINMGTTLVQYMFGSSGYHESAWRINLATPHLQYSAPSSFKAWGDADDENNDAV